MSAYTAFLDVALAVASPGLGLIAGATDLSTVFLASTLVVLCAAAIAVRLLYARSAVRSMPTSRSITTTTSITALPATSLRNGRTSYSGPIG
jgi:hypothetical protein